MRGKASILFAMCLALASCDSGDIYPVDPLAGTHTITITGTFTGTSTIASDERERVCTLMAFTGSSKVANRTMKVSSIEQEGSPVEIEMTKVNDGTTQLVMAILDQSGNEIYRLFEKQITASDNDQRVELGNVNLVSYKRVQTQLYNYTCTSCHSTGNPTKGLNLEDGFSYGMTVDHMNQAGTKEIIIPGDTVNGVLPGKLEYYTTGRNHTTFSTLKNSDIELLKVWIESGADAN